MKRLLSLIAAVCLAVCVLVSGPAKADFQIGNDLYENCRIEKSDFDTGVCFGYLNAMADVLSKSSDRGGYLGWRACLSPGIMGKQIYDVAVQFLKNNPSQRHLSASLLVAHAFSDAWPCPKK